MSRVYFYTIGFSLLFYFGCAAEPSGYERQSFDTNTENSAEKSVDTEENSNTVDSLKPGTSPGQENTTPKTDDATKPNTPVKPVVFEETKIEKGEDIPAGDKRVVELEEDEKAELTTIGFSLIDTANITMSADAYLGTGLANQSLLLPSNGDTKTFDFSKKSFGVTQALADSNRFDKAYHLPELGYIGIGPETVFFLDYDPAVYAEAKIKIDDSKKIVGLIDTGLIVSAAGTLVVIKIEADKTVSQKEIAIDLKSPVVGAGECKSGCTYWMAMGRDLFLLPTDSETWLHFPKILGGLPDIQITKATGSVEWKEKEGELTNFILSDDKGNLYFQDQAVTADLAASWEKVLLISGQSCIPCHQNDGFNVEKGFTDRKADILRRIEKDFAADPEAMPPLETKYGKEFSEADRKIMQDWLKSVDQTAGPGPIGVNPGDDDPTFNNPITGDLKTVSDASCLSCHADASKLGWWKQNKDDAIQRVQSGNMPRNSTLNDADKTKLIQAIQAVE